MMLLTLALFLGIGAIAQYTMTSDISGPSFFDNFDFFTSWDPTFGYVHYVDRATAELYGMINATDTGPVSWGVEHTQVLDPIANLGRLSVRLTSIQSWTHGLFILDLAHMPATTCGTWPAFWMLGTGSQPWPEYGEIDIIEYTNLNPNNSMALHTSPNCTIAGSGQTGKLLTNDCGADKGVAGCYVAPDKPNSAGTNFNNNGGGVYAMEWTSVAIRIWQFSRSEVPPDIATPSPDPSTWGLPDANFESSDCNIDTYFFNHSIIFDTEFCGSWAGPTFVDDGCPALDPTNEWSSCNDFVATNPDAFVDAYWAVNYLQVYTTTPGSPQPVSSSMSSVLPAASTTNLVSNSGAEGRSTTATVSLWPPMSLSFSVVTTSSSSPTASFSSLASSTVSLPPAEPTSVESASPTSSITLPAPDSGLSSSSSSQTQPRPPLVVATTTEVIVVVATVITVAVDGRLETQMSIFSTTSL